MTLIPGTRLGAYEVVAQLGVGGMGEVYRATDTTLKRQVALKVLPASVASDADRLARFQREAEVLAALNHPNIAAIYGIERSGDMTALVMELVEGEDLSQRIARGAIPLDEALPIAKQIAEALEAAHEQGIIHRDLKPANIKVRSDGTVKVLDFGLAKAMEPTGAMSASVSMSPTITTPAMTQAGMILGTAAYMSPEQARGRTVDKRADIWAFGCVLFEMLTGTRAFGGADVQDTFVAIMRDEPDWARLPANVSPTISTYIKRCLQKDPKQRVQAIGDVRLALEGAFETAAPQTTATATSSAPRGRQVLPWAVAVVAVIAGGTTLLLWAPWRPLPAAVPLRVSAELGADASLDIAAGSPDTPIGNTAVVSPDGTQLAFAAQPHGGGAPRLYVRRLDQLTATALAGTDNAVGPFFSPDGQWLGFFGGGKLKKIAVTGGALVTLADATTARGGSWADDGTIVFTPTTANGLWRVPAAGGTPERLTTPAPGEATHRWPQVLPGGRAVLYTVSAGSSDYANAWLAVQPLPTGTAHIVQRGSFYGRYLPSGLGSPTRAEREGGHLTWVHDGALFAAPFDLATLAITGPAVPVVSGVASTSLNGSAQVDVSHTGTLVYLPGGENASAAAPLDWLTRDGKTTPLRATPTNWSGVQIAPNGRRLAFSLTAGANADVWTYDAARDAPTRLTSDPGMDRTPVWTPDGQRLVYSSSSSRSGDALNLYWQRADSSGDATRLTTSPNPQSPGSWHPSGRFLAFSEIRAQTGPDLLILQVEGDEASGWKPGSPTVFLSTPSGETQPRFSPDGRWLAYESTESGTVEIYVRPFPRPGGKFPISAGGGTNAVWSRARRELLYRAPDGRIMVVPYTAAGDAFQAEKPRVWSETPVQVRPLGGASFDLHPDGARVVMAPVTGTTSGPTHVTLIFNFFDELRRLAPVK